MHFLQRLQRDDAEGVTALQRHIPNNATHMQHGTERPFFAYRGVRKLHVLHRYAVNAMETIWAVTFAHSALLADWNPCTRSFAYTQRAALHTLQ